MQWIKSDESKLHCEQVPEDVTKIVYKCKKYRFNNDYRINKKTTCFNVYYVIPFYHYLITTGEINIRMAFSLFHRIRPEH